MISDFGDDFSKFKDEILEITKIKDLDYLFGKFKGDDSQLMKEVEEEEKIEEENEKKEEVKEILT